MPSGDIAISPDGTYALVTLPQQGVNGLVMVDLTTRPLDVPFDPIPVPSGSPKFGVAINPAGTLALT